LGVVTPRSYQDPGVCSPNASMTGPTTNNTNAIVIMLVAVGVFSLMDAGLKLLVPFYPPLQLAALRGAASIPLVLAWALPSVGARGLLRIRWRLHLLRGVTAIGMMTGFVFALDTLPLSTAYAVFFVGPLLVAALSVPVLGETIDRRKQLAIATGVAGVLVVLRPTGEGLFTAAGAAMLVAAACYAISSVTVRVLSRTDTTQAIVFWLVTMLAIGAGVLALPDWVAIEDRHWPIIAGIGVCGALGQWAITQAFTRGEASVVAPFEYTALAYSLGLDLALWGVVPDAVTWVGAGIIVGSGLVLLRRRG
jgi:drug/metabolite transporter (DMT)-like permease